MLLVKRSFVSDIEGVPSKPHALFHSVIVTASQKQALLLIRQEAPVRCSGKCPCHGLATKYSVVANAPESLRAMFQQCQCHGYASLRAFKVLDVPCALSI